MAYIYQIINNINNKVYVGKTQRSLEERFQEHCRDAYKKHIEKRPLYDAIQKYGVEHFHIELLEETNNPEEREIFWIKEKHSYENGYNATLGGDGKRRYNYKELSESYQKLGSLQAVAEKYNCCCETVKKAITENGLHSFPCSEHSKRKNSIIIDQYSLSNNYIKSFSSSMEAARFIRPNASREDKNLTGVASHIMDVCKGKRKSAYGYFWKFHEE